MYSKWTDHTLSQSVCLSQGQQLAKKTLAYYKICPFSVHYKSLMFYSTGSCTKLFKPVNVTYNDSSLQYNMSIFCTLQIHNVLCKGSCSILFKPVKVTDNSKDTSLLHGLSIFCTLQIHNVLCKGSCTILFTPVKVTDNSNDTSSLHNMSISVHYKSLMFYNAIPGPVLY